MRGRNSATSSALRKLLTFVTTAWAGARPIYDPWHIKNVDTMLHKHVTLPFRHVCVTDDVPGMTAVGIEAVPLWSVNAALPPQTPRHYLNNWLRLGMFDPEIAAKYLGVTHAPDVIVSIDADIVIRRNVDHLFRELPAFKIMSLKNRAHLQGGLFAVRPGQVEPNPWRVLHDDPDTVAASRRWGGSDQALLSELFHARTLTGEIPTWNEDDGLAINAQYDHLDWSLFFRTGHRKCWDTRMPEAREYYAQSDRDIETEARKPDILPPTVTGHYPRSGRGAALAAGGLAGLRQFRVLQIAKRKP